jgi:hypothetical protein
MRTAITLTVFATYVALLSAAVFLDQAWAGWAFAGMVWTTLGSALAAITFLAHDDTVIDPRRRTWEKYLSYAIRAYALALTVTHGWWPTVTALVLGWVLWAIARELYDAKTPAHPLDR